MIPAVLLAVFALPVGWGFVAWLYTHCRDRRRMRQAFAHGRSLNVVRLPQTSPVWPVHIRTAGDTT